MPRRCTDVWNRRHSGWPRFPSADGANARNSIPSRPGWLAPGRAKTIRYTLRIAACRFSTCRKPPRSRCADASGRYVLTYNGEIYNYVGASVRTSSQGVLSFPLRYRSYLEAYKAWGMDCLTASTACSPSRFSDSRRASAVLRARPLWREAVSVGVGKGFFAFASEYKALLQHPGRPSRESMSGVCFSLHTTRALDSIRIGRRCSRVSSNSTWRSDGGGRALAGTTRLALLASESGAVARGCRRAGGL